MKHTQKEISEIWDNVKNDKYAGSSAHHMPEIHTNDEVEQCISIPNSGGSARYFYSRKNEGEEWQVDK